MNELITSLFGKNFAPHGYCLAWEGNLLALHVISDIVIFMSYMLIPVFLGIYLLKKGGSLREHRMILGLFSLFILGCGFTHLMGVITIWQAWYYAEGLLKLLTAIVSTLTVVYIYRILPHLLQLPSIEEILTSNQKLKVEILLRQQREKELLIAQSSLMTAETLNAAILNNAANGIITINEQGTILSFNRGSEQMFDYAASEVIGKNLTMLMPPAEVDKFNHALAHYLTTGEKKVIGETLERNAIRKDKTPFPILLEVNEVPILIDGYRVFCGTVENISEKKQREQALRLEVMERRISEAALRESKAIQSAILNNIVDGIVTISETGIMLSFNKSAENIFQYRAEEVIGNNVKMLMPSPYAEEHDGYLVNYIRTHDAKIIGIGREVVGLCKDGSTFPMDLAVSEVNVNNERIFAGVVRNISERKLAEAAAKHFENIVLFSDDAIISKNLDGIITSWNPGAEAMFGYTAEEMRGKPMLLLMPPDRQQEEQIIIEKIKKGEKVEHFDTVRRHKDGTLIDISATISPMYNKEGKIIGASKIARDISKEKKFQASLLEAKQAAEVASIAKSEFLANMSHEIRTPLNGVIGMIELVLDTNLEPKQQRFLKIANDSAGLLLNVINDILDFSKIEAKKLELSPHPFNVRDSVDITMSTLAMRAHDKNLELVCSIAADVPDTTVADSVRLQQILINLVGNAIKFTERGEIVVRVETVPNPELIEADILTLHVSVKDSGMGIPADKQQQIFAAFTQSDASMTRTHGGTGLGLAISQQLVELMGGRIWVESEIGVGSTFHFTLQCGKDQNDLLKNRKVNMKAELKGLRVLIVDDNSTNCLVLCEMLANWGMKPFSTEKPQQALKILNHAENADDPFKLVITDYQMPDTTGLQLAKLIRENPGYSKIPIVVLSSVCSIADFEKQEKLALINGFIDKPVRQSTLLEKIESIVGSHQLEQPATVDKAKEVRINPELRILVADDNETNQMVIGGFFEKQGLKNIVIVDNGLQAVKAYQNAKFDIIFMDVRMPEMDGFQATAAIRELETQQNLPHTPIVALTAHALKEDQDICLAKGMDFYTSKPIKIDELLKLLAMVSDTVSPTPQSSEAETVVVDNPTAETAPRITDNKSVVFNLNAALAPVGGDMVIFKRIVAIYLKNYPLLFEQLKQAVIDKDAEQIHDRAHTLKGSAGNFAAQQVVELAAQLEKMGKTGNINPAIGVLSELEVALSQLAKALENFKD